ncbi:ParB N-terminal domain-containing protein [Embleya sp. NPDC005971]|uniref:ParB/RepB/Spo0J family partition protein n=1 Tax=Embleya sp. NPDC005971 TaxID=3156724 RepID=UPI0033E58DEE
MIATTAEDVTAEAEVPAAELATAVAPRVEVERLTAHPGNVRTHLAVDDAMIASVRASGVIVPLKVTAGGRVIDGHRRLAAALAAGVATVPYETDDATESDQYLAMYTTAEHRVALTPTEKATALFEAKRSGATARRIAKVTGLDADQVRAGITVGGTPAVLDAARGAGYEYTLVELADLARYKDDPEAIERITADADRHSLAYAMRIEDQRRADIAEYARKREVLLAAGHPVRDTMPDEDGATPLHRLSLSPDAHRECPHHVMAPSPYAEHRWMPWCLDPSGHDAPPAHGRSTTPQRTPEERRRVVQGNRHLAAAHQLRQEWLTGFLTRRTRPREASAAMAVQVTRALLGSGRSILDSRYGARARALLDHVYGDAGRFDELIATADARRLPVLQFAGVASCYENDTTTHDNIWRTDDRAPVGSLREKVVEWLTLCRTLGYQPTPIELAIIAGTAYDPDAHRPTDPTTADDDQAPTLTD